MSRFYLCVACVLASLNGAGCQDFRECEQPSSELAQLPERLSQTGLYAELARGELARDVRRFTPQFELWSDGAEKERYVTLPAGSRIDTSDMDDWQFPIGTKLWKQFVRDGVRVETRFELKIGPKPADWALAAYLWHEDQSDAALVAAGQQNARGTAHDVPGAADCIGCHGGRASRVLGFSAVQLAHAVPAADPLSIDLTGLIAADLLTQPPPRQPQVPGSAEQVAGLGYLHANCSHCHNDARPDGDGPRCYDPQSSFDFTLRVAELQRVTDTATYRTPPNSVIHKGNPGTSQVILRMRVRDPDLPSMPPLGTELVDRAGLASVRALIESL